MQNSKFKIQNSKLPKKFVILTLVLSLFFSFLTVPQVDAQTPSSGFFQKISGFLQERFLPQVPLFDPGFIFLRIFARQQQLSAMETMNRGNELQTAALDRFVPPGATKFSVWLPAETAAGIGTALSGVGRAYPHLTFDITTFAEPEIYLSELEKTILRNATPDLFLVNETLFEQLLASREIAPAPSEILLPAEIEQNFYTIAQEFISGTEVLAAPLSGEFLLMFSNRDLLRDERVFVAARPGKTWAEIYSNLQKFREYGDRNILPFALGQPQMAPFTFDIFLLLLRQSGAPELTSPNARDALAFLLDFGQNPLFARFQSAVQGFADGRIAVLFGNENTRREVQNMLRSRTRVLRGALTEENLQIDFVPQFDPQNPQTLGEIWGLAVAADSPFSEFLWALAAEFTALPTAREHYLKTGLTPLRRNIATDIFAENVALAVAGGAWQRVDFRAFFDQNITAFFTAEATERPTLDQLLQELSEFFERNS